MEDISLTLRSCYWTVLGQRIRLDPASCVDVLESPVHAWQLRRLTHTRTHTHPEMISLEPANTTTSVPYLFCAVVISDLWARCEEVWRADPL